MKAIFATITTVTLFFLLFTSAQAGNRQIGGLLLGGSTGAVVGQALGQNTQSTIAGATVGGILGLVIGTELERRNGSPRHPSVTLAHSPRYQKRFRPVYRDHYRGSPRYQHYSRECRKIVTIEKRYHGRERVVSIICDNKFRRYNGHHRGYRYHQGFHR